MLNTYYPLYILHTAFEFHYVAFCDPLNNTLRNGCDVCLSVGNQMKITPKLMQI